MKELSGEVSIGRIRSNRRDDVISIELVDKSSGCRVVEIEMTPEAFGLAITGLSGLPCQFHLYQEAPVGKVREAKLEPVFVPGRPWNAPTKELEDRAAEAIRPYEVDGWEGRIEDAQNSKRRSDRPAPEGKIGSWYNVTFVRFVEPTGQPQEGEETTP